MAKRTEDTTPSGRAFFYGTLMAPEVLYRVCHGTSTPHSSRTSGYTIKPALLHSFARHRVLHADYPAILPDSNGTVRGTYVTGLSEADMWRLDIFEGDEYERRRVKARILEEEGDEQGRGQREGEEVEAETYVWVAGEDQLEKQEWDFAEFRREKMKRWVGGESAEYEEVDEAVKAQEHDPTRGRSLNGHISRNLGHEEQPADDVLKNAV